MVVSHLRARPPQRRRGTRKGARMGHGCLDASAPRNGGVSRSGLECRTDALFTSPGRACKLRNEPARGPRGQVFVRGVAAEPRTSETGPPSHDKQESQFGTGAGGSRSSECDGNVSQGLRVGQPERQKSGGPVCARSAFACKHCSQPVGAAGTRWWTRRSPAGRIHGNVQLPGNAAGAARYASQGSAATGVDTGSERVAATAAGPGGGGFYAHLCFQRDAFIHTAVSAVGGDAAAGSALGWPVESQGILVAGSVGFRGRRLHPVFQQPSASVRSGSTFAAAGGTGAAAGRVVLEKRSLFPAAGEACGRAVAERDQYSFVAGRTWGGILRAADTGAGTVPARAYALLRSPQAGRGTRRGYTADPAALA